MQCYRADILDMDAFFVVFELFMFLSMDSIVMAGLRWWRRTVVFVGSRYWYLLHVKIHIFSCIWGSLNTFWIYLGFAGILNISQNKILLSVHVKVHIQPLYIVSCTTALCVKGGPWIKSCKKLAKVNLGFSSKKITNSYLLLFLSS